MWLAVGSWVDKLIKIWHASPQVRMYQFSATPKRIECVVFESVGGRDNNEGIEIKV
jgi:hypothetical protein